MKKVIWGVLVVVVGMAGNVRGAEAVNLALSGEARASSQYSAGMGAKLAIDGDVESRWVSASGAGPHWLEVKLASAVTIGAAHVHSGAGEKEPIRNFELQRLEGGEWKAIAGTQVRDNAKTAVALSFEPVRVEAVRLVCTDKGFARVKEFMLWEAGKAPELGKGFKQLAEPVDPTRHYVFVNQCGYNAGWPKRFTAPQSADGMKFVVTAVNDTKALFEGTIKKGVGDFSGFEPGDAKSEFVIRVSGGGLKEAVSDPFAVEPRLLQTVALERAVRFMQDARSVVGTHASAYGGGAFRDSTYYTFEMPSLVMLYLSEPEYFNKLPIEIDAAAEKAKVLDASFKLVKANNDETALEAARKYFTELEGPAEGTPDIVRVIHWGAGYYLVNPETRDPSKDPLPKQVHPQTVEQMAFFLYGYPAYKQYIPESFYKRVRDFTLEQWGKVGLFDVIATVGDFKGRHCPGHSIMPNLMMHEVARREGRAEAEKFLAAAAAQAKWVVENLDPADPRISKGQRMSEHKLVPGLVMMLREYPKAAPAGVKKWLEMWADVMIARAENMWDFRKYSEEMWTLPKRSPEALPGVAGGAGWNEPGNLPAFTACAVAVGAVLEDKGKAKRLFEIGVAQIDNLFGRNPVGAHTSYDGKNYRGVDRGWPKKFPDDTCARLERVRGTINSSASEEHYPFNPTGDFRHPEGWTAFNAAFNVGLAYLNGFGERKISK